MYFGMPLTFLQETLLPELLVQLPQAFGASSLLGASIVPAAGAAGGAAVEQAWVIPSRHTIMQLRKTCDNIDDSYFCCEIKARAEPGIPLP